MRYLGVAIVLVFYVSSGLANNQQSQLNHIVEQIKNINYFLQKKHDTRDALQQDLKKIDTQYGEASQKRRLIQQQITDQKQQITHLENDSLLNQKEITYQRQALAMQLRLSYLLQHQVAIKILLNQQNRSDINRMLYYYQSLNTYRIKVIQQLQTGLKQINDHQEHLYQQYQNLRDLELQQQRQEQNLSGMKTNRSQLIETINHSINDQKHQLDVLSQNKKHLEQMLIQLSNRKEVKPLGNFSNAVFSTQRGRLPWPTKGVIQHLIKWNGELIAAPDEQPVYAVAGGTVVFSKWLEGYGLLLIINHGGGYLTLYGRNHSLYKHEGDKVSPGELISTVGQSGGYDKPALYFAIRYKGQPLDPNQWCQ